MMHPVSQTIEPVLKEALAGPTVKTNSREQDVPRRAYVIEKQNVPPCSDALSGAMWMFSCRMRDEGCGLWRCPHPSAPIGLS